MNRSELALLLRKHNQEHLLFYYDKLLQNNKDILSSDTPIQMEVYDETETNFRNNGFIPGHSI